MSNSLYYKPKREIDAYFMPQCQSLNPHISYTNTNHETYASSKVFPGQYCTLESSSGTGTYPVYNSTPSFSGPGLQLDSNSDLSDRNCSPDNVNNSSLSNSCVTDDLSGFRYKLRELETVMLGPDTDIIEGYRNLQNGTHVGSLEFDSWGRVMEMIARKDLKQVLIACARAVAENDELLAHWLMDELRQMVSVSGEPIQRLGAYMMEGLVAKQASSGSSIYKALKCKEPASSDLLSYMHILFEVCPYIKFGYMSANGAIAEATKGETKVHIVDFQIGQGSQWVTLIQAFAARPGGPPHIRITGIDDSYSAYARGGGLNIVGQRLSRLAQSFKVPFEFNAVDLPASQVELKDLGIRHGEALAVNFAFILHHMPDESVSSTENHRDRLLRLVKGVNPKVVTLVEQECNTNSAAFLPRFIETLDYYMAMFESMDVTLSRDHKNRINVEQHCMARDVVNLIACEGAERVERHELLGKWKSRFRMAGFKQYPLSSLVNSTIISLVKNYCDKYRLEERDGALYLGWMNRDLVASCAWQCNN